MSTIDDLSLSAGACLAAGQSSQPDDNLYNGLRLAMENYARVPIGPRFGMAWTIEPGPDATGVVYRKAGGLPGFSSYVAVVPGQDLAITVLCSSKQDDPKTAPASDIVKSVVGTLFQS